MVAAENPPVPEKKWLALRDDLNLYPGPRSRDGTPTWTLYDPTMHRYFRLGWLEFECLQRWTIANAETIAATISHDTPIEVDATDVEAFGEFLLLNQLTEPQGREASTLFARKYQASTPNFWTWLLHNYLFLRIPLVKPDAALKKALPMVRIFLHRYFFTFLVFATFLAIYLVTEQWAVFSHSFSFVFTPEGVLATMGMLSLSKIVHELGHAFTARHFGCRVPSMGIAFMLGFPMLWTDVTDAWRLPNRQQRLFIDAAGMIAELTLAVFATLLWTVLPDGALRSGVYLLATTAWIITLSVNLNPFMRFDGYYLLSDWLEVANLQDRAFSLARWRLREWLFGFNFPPPEYWHRKHRLLLMGYAYGTWIYRLILFTGIAWVVYYFFFKALGLALFAVEIGWFVVRPIVKEIAAWREIIKTLKTPLRPRLTWLLPLIFLALLFIPWRSHVLFSGLFHAEAEYTLYSSQAAMIKRVLVHEDEKVVQDQVLIELVSPDLDFKLATATRKLEELTQQLTAQSVDRNLARNNPMDMEALQSVLAELNGLQEARKKLTLRASFAGYLRDLSDVLQEGEWVAKDEPLGVVEAPNATVVAYIEEADLRLLKLGATGRFYPEGGDVAVFPVEIIAIDKTGTRQLTRAELASSYGGEVAVHEDEQHHLIPEQGVYRVLLKATPPPLKQAISIRGRLSVETPPESLIKRVLRLTMAVLIRESGW